MKTKKKKSNKYIYYFKEKYLFYLPIPRWIYCEECSRVKRLEWNKKGFVLLKTTRCRRKKTMMDVVGEGYQRLFVESMENPFGFLGSPQQDGISPTKSIKFKRYGKLSMKD